MKLFIKIGLVLLVLAAAFVYWQFRSDIKKSRTQLASYDVQIIASDFGAIHYLDAGEGTAVLLSHGMFGGYDQAAVSINQLVGDNHRKLAVSRFGYLGSEIPNDPSPTNQAKAFADLLDALNIDKTFIIGTSAGGAASIQFALLYPERTSGLILLSSGAPDRKLTLDQKDEMGMTGPPSIFINDCPIWISLKYVPTVFRNMFGSQNKELDLLETMLPVKERRPGILNDTEVTNTDMYFNFDDYALEKISVPTLVIHAKDDPMAPYEAIAKLIDRVPNVETVIFDTGGHLLEGQDTASVIRDFIIAHP